MAQPKDHLSDLDHHMQHLEAKVEQLRASLTHWQQWYLEYSALKEEVELLPKEPQPRKDLARIRRDFDSQLLTKKEINEIFGKTDLKNTEQIISVLSRRIDYVETNVNTLRKQLEAEEDRLSAVSVVAHPDGGTDEETGLPITDIIEELDEEGNVVCSRLQSGADAGSKAVAALKQAGIRDLPETEEQLVKDDAAAVTANGKENVAPLAADAGESPAEVKPTPEEKSNKTEMRSRRSVSFAEDTKPGHEAGDQPVSKTAQRVAELMRMAKESESLDMSDAVIPDDESPEDSAVRREMLKYNMSEMGHVVAELVLEEDGSDIDDDEGWEDEELEASDYDDEDDLGRSKHSVITDDYIKRMKELEKRLQSQGAFSVARSDSHAKDEGAGVVTVMAETNGSASTKASKESKSVRFAANLDIAEEKPSQPAPKAKKAKPAVNPVGDIVEQAVAHELEDDDATPKRISRFKKERAAGVSVPAVSPLPPGPLQFRPKLTNQTPTPEPAPPEGLVIAPAVVERSPSSAPKEPDDMDDVLLYQAAAVEYNRLRNKMIQRQGGFAKQEEPVSATLPLDEEEGGPPRVSRFKAARLAKS
ncbi:Prefoldin subunit-domain-containing protein [Podospora aff. communis PSN243]|uniref:Prefoldin subunit-domain-containing protein n=1 Tax=Podospora aff. communis PSN243 TaxID=3040156 RepID=A0AAV9H2D5_9PEZI|nr:Prefoldin subunit-domain-containing protein [Podospora aff. communis PSN243]